MSRSIMSALLAPLFWEISEGSSSSIFALVCAAGMRMRGVIELACHSIHSKGVRFFSSLLPSCT